jgi:hypothetical protein
MKRKRSEAMPRLTKLEKEMLHRAAGFVLAGEWPWEESGAGEEETPRERRERLALESARTKLNGDVQ